MDRVRVRVRGLAIAAHSYSGPNRFQWGRKLEFARNSVWNSLPNHVVSADTINTFKNRLDKFWSNQEVLYDYNADLYGIGNRSLL